jgi:osmoprotectant transport system ATP-binding protein
MRASPPRPGASSLTRPNTAHTEGPSAHPQAATLEFREVTKAYPGSEEPAIRELSFEVPAGETCVLVGPSGCGKTTAMRLVNRMIELTSGDILLDGRSVRERPPAELRRDIGYAIQQIGLFPHQTIGDNIATVPRLRGWDRARVRARVEELLELIGLDPELRTRYPAQLSGGQRQRVGVARALAADPPLMLMDEPFGAIDPINRERLQNEFLRLQRELRKTVVFVTHDIDEAIKMGDRIAVLKKGGILAQYAPPAELLMRPVDAFVEDFVGADRALKRLALERVADARLEPPPPVGRDTALTVRRDTSLRDALSALLADRAEQALVVDGEGEPVGVLTIESIHRVLAAEAAGAPHPA